MMVDENLKVAITRINERSNTNARDIKAIRAKLSAVSTDILSVKNTVQHEYKTHVQLVEKRTKEYTDIKFQESLLKMNAETKESLRIVAKEFREDLKSSNSFLDGLKNNVLTYIILVVMGYFTFNNATAATIDCVAPPVNNSCDDASSETWTLTYTPPPPQCSDGLDNDSDTLIDYPADPGCTDANDNDETDPPSGTWQAIANSALTDFYPNVNAGLMDAWSGGGFVHPYLGVMGCGHSDCNDNGLYAFNVVTNGWELLSTPTSNPQPDIDIQSDGRPTARHTYGMVIGCPTCGTSGSFIMGSGSVAGQGWCWNSVHQFDIAASAWINRGALGNSSCGAWGDYNATDGHIYVYSPASSNSVLDRINTSTWTVTNLLSQMTRYSGYKTGRVCDGVLYGVGSGDTIAINLTTLAVTESSGPSAAAPMTYCDNGIQVDDAGTQPNGTYGRGVCSGSSCYLINAVDEDVLVR
jgi:hypothetical protein